MAAHETRRERYDRLVRAALSGMSRQTTDDCVQDIGLIVDRAHDIALAAMRKADKDAQSREALIALGRAQAYEHALTMVADLALDMAAAGSRPPEERDEAVRQACTTFCDKLGMAGRRNRETAEELG